MTEFRHASLFKSKLDSASRADKYRLLALTYAESPYGWGFENLRTADCSGLLCGPLLFMGYKLRTNAHGLLTKYSTEDKWDSNAKVRWIFFVTEEGIAKHCGIYMSEDVVMHASGARGLTFDYDENLIAEYLKKDMTPKFRFADWSKIEVADEVYDIDEEMA